MSAFIDTIAAIATPSGSGGIAIIRISGSLALPILKQLFIPHSQSFLSFKPRYMHYGRVCDSAGKPIDRVLAVYMPAPHSATGEDVCEIHCHGGQAIAASILESVLHHDARLAAPGEFTKRAFLHGRIDLTQAEAIAEAIAAPTKEGIRLAEAKMSGALSRSIANLREPIDSLRAELVATLDFFEDEPEATLMQSISAQVARIQLSLQQLLAGYQRARLWREGASVVLVGQVNAGKSSLLNALLGRERAIVSDQPGTTRDYIEEQVNIQGLPLRIVDTAGLRVGGDIVESEGIKRSIHLAEEAELLLLVVDTLINDNNFSAEQAFITKHKNMLAGKKLLIVLNKTELLTEEAIAKAKKSFATYSWPLCVVSTATGLGIDSLCTIIAALLQGDTEPIGTDIAPNLRQSTLLHMAETELAGLLSDIDAGIPLDLVALRLDSAAKALEEVTGFSSSEDMLDTIFSSFCIGK